MKKSIKTTRFHNLGYAKEAPKTWSFYHVEGDYIASIGAKYTSQIELLADAQRFAEERGYDSAS